MGAERLRGKVNKLGENVRGSLRWSYEFWRDIPVSGRFAIAGFCFGVGLSRLLNSSPAESLLIADYTAVTSFVLRKIAEGVTTQKSG